MTQPHALDGLYPHQVEWVNDESRNMGLLAARQTGKTRSIARKQFFNRALKGIPQNFVAATKRQAYFFRQYIKDISFQEFGVKLYGGDEIILQLTDKQVPIRFLPANEAFGQGSTGDITFDEIAWMRKFTEVKNALGQIAGQKKYIKNFITTPSSMSSPAYAFLEGINDDGTLKPRDEKGNILDHRGKVLLSRHHCTLPHAIKQGYDLFDIDDIIAENAWPVYEQFYLLKWINEKDSFFSLSELEENCYVSQDKLNLLLDPNNPISWGYDPARSRDAASFTGTQLNMNSKIYARFYNKRFYNLASHFQAKHINQQLRKYPTSYFLGIDVDGYGISVKDDVEIQGYPCGIQLQQVFNQPVLKENLILAVKRLIERGRYKYLETDNTYTSALLAIKQSLTNSGQKTTYITDRRGNSHGDDAWSSIYSLWPAMMGHQKLNRKTLVADASRVSIS